MSVVDDKFSSREAPERLYYATGVFLEAEDLLAEQTYHRGRLSRVLAYLHGSGTAAGLEVSYDAASDELRVAPGLAVDRLGRLVEVPRTAAMRVSRWFDWVRGQVLAPPADSDAATPRFVESMTADRSALVADLYVRFVVCERGRTPAFADGPFDAIDATVPERLRDGYRLDLVLRGGEAGGLPGSAWPARGESEDLAAWEARMRDAVLGAWRQGTDHWEGDRLAPDASTEGAPDPTAVLLARVRVPLQDVGAALPGRRVDGDGVPVAAEVDNHCRSFVWSSAALVRWISAVQGTFRG